jgi:hypothetical protein
VLAVVRGYGIQQILPYATDTTLEIGALGETLFDELNIIKD